MRLVCWITVLFLALPQPTLFLSPTFKMGVLSVVGGVHERPSRQSSIDYTGKTLSNHRFINDTDGAVWTWCWNGTVGKFVVCEVPPRIVCAVLFGLPSLLLKPRDGLSHTVVLCHNYKMMMGVLTVDPDQRRLQVGSFGCRCCQSIPLVSL